MFSRRRFLGGAGLALVAGTAKALPAWQEPFNVRPGIDATAGLAQAVQYAFANGLNVQFPDGFLTLGGLDLSIPPYGGCRIFGSGATTIFPREPGMTLFRWDHAESEFRLRFDGFGVDFGWVAGSGTRAFDITRPRNVMLTDLWCKNVGMAAVVDRGIGITVRDIVLQGDSNLKFWSSDPLNWIFGVELETIRIDPARGGCTTDVLMLDRIACSSVKGFKAHDLQGKARGIVLRGDCQGITIADTLMVAPTVGIKLSALPDGAAPLGIIIDLAHIDQPGIACIKSQGLDVSITDAKLTNGAIPGNSEAALNIMEGATDHKLSGVSVWGHSGDGIRDRGLDTQYSNVKTYGNAMAGHGFDWNVPLTAALGDASVPGIKYSTRGYA